MSKDLDAALEYVRELIADMSDVGHFEDQDDEEDDDPKQLRRIEVLLMRLERLEEEAET